MIRLIIAGIGLLILIAIAIWFFWPQKLKPVVDQAEFQHELRKIRFAGDYKIIAQEPIPDRELKGRIFVGCLDCAALRQQSYGYVVDPDGYSIVEWSMENLNFHGVISHIAQHDNKHHYKPNVTTYQTSTIAQGPTVRKVNVEDIEPTDTEVNKLKTALKKAKNLDQVLDPKLVDG